MSELHQPILLVTGGSGKLGRRVIELLLEAGTPAEAIVTTTRTPEKLADLSARGVAARPADFDDPASLASAFAKADRLLLISTDVAGQGDRRLKQHLNAVKAAEAAGVSHVIYTSLIKPGPDSPVTLAPDHHGTEQALAASRMSWTILRENIYTDAQVGALARAAQTGQLINAAGDGKTAFVTRENCAQAAAAALLAAFDGRRTLDISGPEAASMADLAAIASELTGRAITYIPLPLDVLRQNLVSAGLPLPIADLIVSFDAGMAEGRFSEVSPDFEELTGRKPTRAADFLAEQREALLPAAD